MVERGRRRDISAVGSIDEIALRNQMAQGERAKRELEMLTPRLEQLQINILTKIKDLSLQDMDSLQLLKLQLHAVTEIERMIKLEITHGKQAQTKLEEYHDQKRSTRPQ